MDILATLWDAQALDAAVARHPWAAAAPVGPFQLTPLHTAAMVNSAAIPVLVRAGADLEARLDLCSQMQRVRAIQLAELLHTGVRAPLEWCKGVAGHLYHGDTPLTVAAKLGHSAAVTALVLAGARVTPSALQWLCRRPASSDTSDAMYLLVQRGCNFIAALADPYAEPHALRLLLAAVTVKWLAGGEHLSPAEIVTIVRAAVRSQDRIAFTWFFPFAPLSLPGVAAQLMEELLAARDTTGMEVFLTTSAGAALAQSAAGSWAVTRAIEDGDTPTAGLLLDHGARLAPSMRVLRDHVVTAVTRDASALVKLRRLLQHGYRPGLEQAPGSAEQPLWLSDMEVDANTDSWGVSQSDTPCPIHFLLAMAHARLSLWSKTYVLPRFQALAHGDQGTGALVSSWEVHCVGGGGVPMLLRRFMLVLESLREWYVPATYAHVVWCCPAISRRSPRMSSGVILPGKPDHVQLHEEQVSVLEISREAFTATPELRMLWMTAAREEWTPETHRHYPPLFKEAVRTLLLAQHTGRRRGGATRQLHALSREQVQEIIKVLATFPMSSWL